MALTVPIPVEVRVMLTESVTHMEAMDTTLGEVVQLLREIRDLLKEQK